MATPGSPKSPFCAMAQNRKPISDWESRRRRERRPKADFKRDFGLGALRRPAQNHARRPEADLVKVRPHTA